jgi:hypothetical protein
VGLRHRLARLEGTAGGAGRSISREALKALPFHVLDALEDVLEAAELGEDPRATERGRRALDAYTYALEAARRGERRGA